jgi:hypothetical protein
MILEPVTHIKQNITLTMKPARATSLGKDNKITFILDSSLIETNYVYCVLLAMGAVRET